MREIKFRGWDNQSMEYSDKYNSLEQFFAFQLPILMQYTGLKDKNGKEIYEGDILAHDKLKKAKIVKWNDTQCGFNIKCWSPIITNNKDHSWEVIGNIYENHELLEKP